MKNQRLLKCVVWVGVFGMAGGLCLAQGNGGHRHRGGRGGHDATFVADRADFHALLEHHGRIQRSVTKLPDGIVAVTESDDAAVAKRIQKHVGAMYARVEEDRPIRRRDPLFDALFGHASKIEMKVEQTERGVRVTETSDDPYVATLIQAHAQVVSLFVAHGFEEAHRNHAVPARPTDEHEQRKREAMDAVGRLKKKLFGRLAGALAEAGPAHAIDVCKRDAPALAARIGQERGVRIGRTSFKRRNPNNVVPEWARPAVHARDGDPLFYELVDGNFGALLPIRLQQQCLTCHGPSAQIPADVRSALKEQYPDDAATGFREGELRGWFWVEVPVN